jgi:TetR/AcrR family transcriptional regulator, transcriptional repressor for nem operon
VVRKKGYDRDELLEKAMQLFRDHGFSGTSTQMLVERLGVNRNSMYSEFGSKQALFDAALERYDEQTVTRNFGPLEAPDAGLEQVRALLEFFAAAATGPAAGRGCLLCNTAIEFGPHDPSGRGFVGRYFKRLSGAFLNALQNAQRADVLRASVDIFEEAHFFTASVLGMFVMLRAKAPPEVLQSSARIAIQHLESLCRKSSDQRFQPTARFARGD